jgi:hypothetical protein
MTIRAGPTTICTSRNGHVSILVADPNCSFIRCSKGSLVGIVVLAGVIASSVGFAYQQTRSISASITRKMYHVKGSPFF